MYREGIKKMEHGLIRNEEKAKVLELAIKALDGDILLEECKELEGYISSSKTLAAYYSTCIKTHLSMLEFESSYDLLKQKNDSTLDREFWQMLAIYEQISPEVEIPTVSQEPEAGCLRVRRNGRQDLANRAHGIRFKPGEHK